MDTNKKLDALYKEIPEIECKGLCHTTCGVVPLTLAENNRIKDVNGIDMYEHQKKLLESNLDKPETLTCPMLKDQKCTVHSIRPMLCRLYGNVQKMKCLYGCTPKKTFLPQRKARKLLAKLEKVKP